MLHEETAHLARAAMASAMKTGYTNDSGEPVIIRYKDSPEGEAKWVFQLMHCVELTAACLYRWSSVFSCPDFGPDGRLQTITGVTMDISAQKKVEAFERHRAEEAIELRRAQERFIDTVS